MDKELHIFSRKEVAVYFDAEFSFLTELCDPSATILLVDQEVYKLHGTKLKGYRVIEIPGGEPSKQQGTINAVVEQLLQMEADRDCWIVGVGGGVITDIAGYVASIYKRGVKLGLVPTSIMAMADAAIGGKNGIDVGVYKNMVGTIYQPEFILYDYSFLDTLPVKEWVNGFCRNHQACLYQGCSFVFITGRTQPERFSE
jgi:3-dehydroquinate synthetase